MGSKKPDAWEILRHAPPVFYRAIRDAEERVSVIIWLLTVLGLTVSGFTGSVPDSARPWLAASGLAGLVVGSVLLSAADLLHKARERETLAVDRLTRGKRVAKEVIAKKRIHVAEVEARLREMSAVEITPTLDPVQTTWTIAPHFGKIDLDVFQIRLVNTGQGTAFCVRIKLISINNETVGGEDGNRRLPEYICDPENVVGGEHITVGAIGVYHKEEKVFFGVSHFLAPIWTCFLTGGFQQAQFRVVCDNDGIKPVDFVITNDPPSLRIQEPPSPSSQ